MDPVLNPFANPASAVPGYVATRGEADEALEQLRSRVASGCFAVAVHLVGARGIGKSVALRLLARSCEAEGIFAPYVTGTGRDRAGSLQHVHQVVSAQHEAFLARRAKQSRRTLPVEIKGRISAPYVPVSLEVEKKAGNDGGPPALHALQATVQDLVNRGTRTVIILDEAELFPVGLYDELLVELLGSASEHGAPLSAVTAGATFSYVRKLYDRPGALSFASALGDVVPLTRLTPEEARRLLVATAELAGLQWDGLAWDPVVNACHGVPRWLQRAGSEIFASSDITDAGLQKVADNIRRAVASLADRVVRPEEFQLRAAVRACVPVGQTLLEEEALAQLLRQLPHEPVETLVEFLERLEATGVLERTHEQTLTMLASI